MIDHVPPGHFGSGDEQALPLTVGCTLGLTTAQPATAIVQVAPRLQAGVCIGTERWEASSAHHSYVDHYGIAARGSSSRRVARTSPTRHS
jgi:hypothetical protein